MSFSDVASRMRRKSDDRSGKEQQQDAPRDFNELYLLRARILGVLVRDARQATDLSIAQCAKLIDVPAERLERWELGKEMPSMPQLELLAYVLDLPISHFWGTETVLRGEARADLPAKDYVELRTRLIGALLRQARQTANLEPETVAAQAGISTARLGAYELGQQPIPLPVLVSLASACRVNLGYFLENGNRVGEFLLLQEDMKQFSLLPEEVRHFVTAPVNMPYIELAMKIARLGSDELRGIATSILDITL